MIKIFLDISFSLSHPPLYNHLSVKRYENIMNSFNSIKYTSARDGNRLMLLSQYFLRGFLRMEIKDV